MQSCPYDDPVDTASTSLAMAPASLEWQLPAIPSLADGQFKTKLAASGDQMRAYVSTFVVTTDNLAVAYGVMRHIRRLRETWKSHMQPHIDGAMEAKRVAEKNRKRLVEEFESYDTQLADAEAAQNAKIEGVEAEAERLRVVDQVRLQAQENARYQESVLAHAIATIEEAHAEPVAEVREALLAVADEIIDAPSLAPVVVLPSARPTGTGVSRPVVWEAEIHDLSALLRAFIDKKLDADLMAEFAKRFVDGDIMPPLNQRATRLRAALAIPGVRAIKKNGTYRIR